MLLLRQARAAKHSCDGGKHVNRIHAKAAREPCSVPRNRSHRPQRHLTVTRRSSGICSLESSTCGGSMELR